jgi:hypothetical protein
MAKRAVDLSVAELATMGAKAAQRAAQKAREAGLVLTGTVQFFEGTGGPDDVKRVDQDKQFDRSGQELKAAHEGSAD